MAVERGASRGPTSADTQTQTDVQTQSPMDTQTQADIQAQAQRLTDTHTGKTVKSKGNVTELLQSALQLPADTPAHQLAQALLSQQQTALTELGMALSDQHQLPRSEQITLVNQTATNALSDQTVGELARLLNSESLTTNSLAELLSSDNRATIDAKKSDFKRRFTAGEISTRISPQKQARHIYNSKEYMEYVNVFKKQGRLDLPSYIRQDLSYSDLEKLVVAKLCGDVTAKKDGSFVEYVQCDEPIGYYYSPFKGKYIETSCAQVKYSLGNGNIHIIPVKNLLKGD